MPQSFIYKIDNLGFRPVTDDDLGYLLSLDADPEIRRFFPSGVQSHKEIEDKIQRYKREYAEKGYGTLLVFELNSGEFIGRAGFGDIESGEIEVGYLVLKQYWGKGYATRILKALLAWAKDNIHQDKIIAYTPIKHAASERVMQKAGMVFNRTAKMQGEDCVIYEYKISRDQ